MSSEDETLSQGVGGVEGQKKERHGGAHRGVRDESSEVWMARTKSFTRRSRDLSPGLRRTLQAHASDYVLDVKRGLGYTTVAEDVRLNLTDIFGREAPVTVEIGSGTGEQVVHSAAACPERDFLCFEVWVPGIAKLVSKAVDADVHNIRVIEADAQQALPIVLAEATIDEVWTFFPDPWRKNRHHKRRLVQPTFALEVARLLVDGGRWRLATDWDDYAWQMRDVVEECPLLSNPHAGERVDPNDPRGDHGGFAPRWDGRMLTHFERRGQRAGRAPHDVLAVRRPRCQPSLP